MPGTLLTRRDGADFPTGGDGNSVLATGVAVRPAPYAEERLRLAGPASRHYSQPAADVPFLRDMAEGDNVVRLISPPCED